MENKDFFKDWPKVKDELKKVSQEAMEVAKKGEAKLRLLSQKGKMRVDITALTLKKEHLFFRIGQEYVRTKCPGPHSPKLAQLIDDIRKIDKDIKKLENSLKKGKPADSE